ncbi:hypothetical protein GCM10022222_31950 [Amycolatopsis ultiminotia]|uniref:YbaB/EbfC DNA-binding family protein n=1 Tax=Amycolatopsis ultiminotia TaxID=543629 RepID=A0ABP6W709_9PSEU
MTAERPGAARKARGEPNTEQERAVAALSALSLDQQSADGAVAVSVNTDGVLTRLRLGAEVTRMSPAEIANAVLRTYNQAQQDAALRTAELLAPLGVRGYVIDRLRWRAEFTPQPASEPAPTRTQGAHRMSRTARDAHNEYLKDRSAPGYDLVPPIPPPETGPATDDDWFADGGVRIMRTT